MALLSCTEKLIADVEELSGRKVVVQEDPKLSVLSTVQTARSGAPFHFVRYKASGDTVNYLLVYQLSFLVRLFSCNPENRWEVASNVCSIRDFLESEREKPGINLFGRDRDNLETGL